jgi:hypothetical protein
MGSKIVVLALLAVVSAPGCKDKGPHVTIGIPQNESHFALGDTIHFAADLNSDTDPGRISLDAWRWVSDRDGQLGTSPRLDTPNLSAGKHVVTVSVPHRLGTSSASVTVFVDSASR